MYNKNIGFLAFKEARVIFINESLFTHTNTNMKSSDLEKSLCNRCLILIKQNEMKWIEKWNFYVNIVGELFRSHVFQRKLFFK